jgi:uncharacterized protein YecE (DUF72 family)
MLPYSHLSESDFLLPGTDQPFLPGTKNRTPQFYLGLPGWNYRGQERSRSSPDPKPGTLPFYARYFNATELNSSHHTLPTADETGKWYRSVKEKEFKICPQIHHDISDTGRIGLPKIGLTNQFIDRLKGLQDKLGSAFIRVPENYSWEDKASLLDYFKALPADFEMAVELTNPALLADTGRMQDLAAALNRSNKGTVITDAPGCREAVHMQLSTPVAFIRFYCGPELELDMFRIEQWKKQLWSWYLQGLERCYFFLHIENKEAEVEFSEYVKYELNFG